MIYKRLAKKNLSEMFTSGNMYGFFAVGSLVAVMCTLTHDSYDAELESQSPSDSMLRAVSAIAETAVNAFGNMLSLEANQGRTNLEIESPSNSTLEPVSTIAQSTWHAAENIVSSEPNCDQDQDQKNPQQKRKRVLCGDAAESRKTQKVL